MRGAGDEGQRGSEFVGDIGEKACFFIDELLESAGLLFEHDIIPIDSGGLPFDFQAKLTLAIAQATNAVLEEAEEGEGEDGGQEEKKPPAEVEGR